MFEPGTKMFRVRCTRDGEHVLTLVLAAFDVDDALARAKNLSAESKELRRIEDNPFDNVEGLDVCVEPLS
jgi:hypothetical protein